jgi:hypothetical protein
MEPCYTPKSNYISLDREVANMTVRGCNARVVVHSASFFSIPSKLEANAGRRCMLSMSIIFTPTKKSNISDFSCTFKFEEYTGTTYGRVPPIVRSHHFLSLEKDTNFLADFGDKLKEEPCNLGEDWEDKGYADLFSIMGDASNKDRYAWATGHGTSDFSVKAEGYLGKPAGVVETLPICILLDYRDAAPPTLVTSVSARVGVEKKGRTCKSQMVTRFALGRTQPRYSDRYLPAFEMSGGPKLAVLDGDRLGPRSSRLPCLVRATFLPPARTSIQASLPPDTRQEAPPIDAGDDQSSGNAGKENDQPDSTKGEAITPEPAAPSQTEPTLSTRPSSQLEPTAGAPTQAASAETAQQVNTSAPWPWIDPMIFLNAFVAEMSQEELAAYQAAAVPAQHLVDLLQDRFGDDLPRYYGCTWRDFDSRTEEKAYRDMRAKAVGSQRGLDGASRAECRDEKAPEPPRDLPASRADAEGTEPVKDGPKRPLSDTEREMQAEAYLARLVTYWTRKRSLESLREVFDVEPQAGLRRLEQHALSVHGPNWREHLSTAYRFKWSDMLLRLEKFAEIRKGPANHWSFLVQRIAPFLAEAPISPGRMGDAGVDAFLRYVTETLVRENRVDLIHRIFGRDARRGLAELRQYIGHISELRWSMIPLRHQFDWEDVGLRLRLLAEVRRMPEKNWPSILKEIMELAARAQVPFPVSGQGQGTSGQTDTLTEKPRRKSVHFDARE